MGNSLLKFVRAFRYILYMSVYGARDNAGFSFSEALKCAVTNEIACLL